MTKPIVAFAPETGYLAVGGEKKKVSDVLDPLGRKITSHYLMLDDKTAFIEMANASGIEFVKGEVDERDPLKMTTYGTGQLIGAAVNGGAKRLIIGIGGSATNDGGIGMAQALGIKFLDGGKEELEEGLESDDGKILYNGGMLSAVK